MQIGSLRVKSYRSWKVDEVSGPKARARLWRLEKFAEMRAERVFGGAWFGDDWLVAGDLLPVAQALSGARRARAGESFAAT